ncbi:MAG: hypothetical protein IPG04_39440 [Polyangiaceae bacterium]|nr:hypothetical protein [Polyangiaceae bacterium]
MIPLEMSRSCRPASLALLRVLQPSGVLAEVRRDLGERHSPVFFIFTPGPVTGVAFARCLDDRGDLSVLAMP